MVDASSSQSFMPHPMKYDSTIYHRELSRVLNARYVPLAFDLPPDSGSIWNLLKDDIDSLGSHSQGDILVFLRNFFSESLMQIVASNLVALKESFLTIEYTLGRGNTAVAKAIVDGILEEAAEQRTPLAQFLGHVSELDESSMDEEEMDNNEGWQIVCRRRAKGNRQQVVSDNGSSANQEAAGSGDGSGNNRNAGEDLSEPGHTAEGDGSGDGGSGGSGGPGIGPRHFPSMQDNIVHVHLPAFVTPTRDDSNRKLTIKERSLLFWNEAQKCCSGLRLYDPHTEQGPGHISILHGTHTSSLTSFQVKGILPDFTRKNEFSHMPALYVSNSMQHAFERPLHYKPGRDAEDYISVMEFFVDVDVLHGKKPPPGQSTRFDIRWFQQPSEDWKRFCIGNMATDPELEALAPLHSHDIVIGPVCKPLDGGKDMGMVTDRLGRSKVFVNQVAFCTPRAWSWLEGCLRRVFQERRDGS